MVFFIFGAAAWLALTSNNGRVIGWSAIVGGLALFNIVAHLGVL